MLVIISDLHLTDGTSGETIKAGAFRIFRQRLSDMAYDASWRSDGTYRPVERIDLVLLGDVLDAIRSTKWLFDKNGNPGDVRPWSNPQSQSFIDKLQEITRAILEENRESLAVLRGFSGERPITIPPAKDGKPAKVSHNQGNAARLPVEVRTHYTVGNHDWFYHLPGPAHNQIRREIVDAMGLVSPFDRPFPHDPTESDELMALYGAYRVFARHADIYDPFNFEGERDAATLGDAVVVELVNRFPMVVRQRLAGQLPPACFEGLKEIDNVRPKLMIPVWINSLLNRTVPDVQQRRQVKDIWDELADDFLNLPFVRERDKALDFFDTVDQLEWALKFSQGLSLGTISKVAKWVKEKVTDGELSSYQHAFKEEAFLNKKARFIVHGHTHHQQLLPLDSALVNGERVDQLYFNSGTWRRIHEIAQYKTGQEEFMGFHEMTYIAFFKDDERKGRPFEIWTGHLGVD